MHSHETEVFRISLWTSRVWVMITKWSPTLHRWNAPSWTGRTTVQALHSAGSALKSQTLTSLAIIPDSCPVTYLEPASLWKVSVTPYLLIYFCGLWGIKSVSTSRSLHRCHCLEVLSDHQEHWPSCRGTPCCLSQLHTASVLNSRSVRTVRQHKADHSEDFSPAKYLLGINFVAILLFQQPKIIKKLKPRWKLISKDESLNFRLWLILCKISSRIATYLDNKDSVRMEKHIMNAM